MRAVNLLPREVKRTRQRLTVAGQLAIVSPFVVGALITAGYLLASSKVNDKKAALQDAQARLAVLPAPKPVVQPNPQLALERDQRVAALTSALQGRLAWDRLLREVSAVLPDDVWLTKLSGQAPQASAPASAPAGSSTDTTSTSTTTTTTTTTTATPTPTTTSQPLSLDGYTYSQPGVARFLTRLALIPELQDVKLVSSNQSTLFGRNVYSFSVEATVKPQATQ
jgi:Tfp pilus assembly protein PilN